jgi:hypothetical protein
MMTSLPGRVTRDTIDRTLYQREPDSNLLSSVDQGFGVRSFLALREPHARAHTHTLRNTHNQKTHFLTLISILTYWMQGGRHAGNNTPRPWSTFFDFFSSKKIKFTKLIYTKSKKFPHPL